MLDRADKLLKAHNNDFKKAGMPGSSSWTPFKVTLDAITEFVLLHEGCEIKEAIKATDTHWASVAGAKAGLFDAIIQGLVPWIRVSIKKEKGRKIIYMFADKEMHKNWKKGRLL